VPPDISLLFPPALEVTSPGNVTGSLYAFDTDGLGSLHLRFRSADLTVDIDSFVALNPEIEQTRGILLLVPDGLPVGTQLTLVTTVSDLAGFEATDSTSFTTQPGP
jgi:hypothetical protein